MRDRKVLFIYAKFQKPRQSSIVAASHNIPWGPELPRGQNYPTLPYCLYVWRLLGVCGGGGGEGGAYFVFLFVFVWLVV